MQGMLQLFQLSLRAAPCSDGTAITNLQLPSVRNIKYTELHGF